MIISAHVNYYYIRENEEGAWYKKNVRKKFRVQCVNTLILKIQQEKVNHLTVTNKNVI